MAWAVTAACLLVVSAVLGASTWSPTDAAATRSATITVETPDGRPAVGLGLMWYAKDGSAESAKCKVTDAEGKIRWNTIPLVPVEFAHCYWNYGVVQNGPNLTHYVTTTTLPPTGPVKLKTGPVPSMFKAEVHVVMPDGTPIADAVVKPGNGDTRGSYHWGGTDVPTGDDAHDTIFWQACPFWDPSVHCPVVQEIMKGEPVNPNGVAKLWRFTDLQPARPNGDMGNACYKVIYDDGDLKMNASTGPCSGTGPVTVTLPYMPVVEVAQPPLDAVLAGSEVEVSVKAVDGVGAPLSAMNVAAEPLSGGGLASLASVAPAAACSQKLSAKTGRLGKATLRICADKTRRWRTDGKSLVPSRSFQVLVRKKGSPSKPRDLTVSYPAPDKAKLRWRTPKDPGWSKIKKYQVRWSTDGGYRWSSWKSTGLKRELGGVALKDGKKYIFQVRAVNGRGGGGTAKKWGSAPI